MNKKIQELIAKSGLEWCAQTDQDKQNLEEFAELIIIEACDIIHKNKRCPDGFLGSHEAGFQLGCNVSIENIKQHFGL